MEDDKRSCGNCEKQEKLGFPHADLKLISSIPESSIYRCECCGAFWIHDGEDGWENLDFDTLWGLAC
ncbi:hypothetical protein ACMXYN_16010 [Neptuniibacter sp. PT8_73]|uniref:hypothetical protein n=1 Tax=unclassified Neptuniibacter TaxID=2630693 RepID=UPI0039F66815